MIGKLYSGSWGNAIFPPDDEIAIDGDMKIDPNINRNSGGLILRFLSRILRVILQRSISLAVRGLFTPSLINRLWIVLQSQKHSRSI